METPTQKLSAAIADNESRLDEYIERASTIGQRAPGWSRHFHYLFFKSWLDAFPEAKTVLILGVYLGRDISFMLDAAKGRELQVVGVDKFNAQPCDDWPEEKRGMTWEQAFNCAPPDAKKAMENINAQHPHVVRLIEADDAAWLPLVQGRFDLAYIDTSHDFATVARQIKQVRPLCHANTIIAGDDYNDAEKTWGVRQAVSDGFKSHQVLAGMIWFAGAEDFKCP
jgi:hypothetical protein